MIKTDFKRNPVDKLQKHGNFSCRFKGEDGQVKYTAGTLVRYPLEPFSSLEKPNNIRCKSPKWDLKGKDKEPVKMDISINGQDYSGNFDFTFTVALMLHRDLPMSGPVQGNTTTKLFG